MEVEDQFGEGTYSRPAFFGRHHSTDEFSILNSQFSIYLRLQIPLRPTYFLFRSLHSSLGRKIPREENFSCNAHCRWDHLSLRHYHVLPPAKLLRHSWLQ